MKRLPDIYPSAARAPSHQPVALTDHALAEGREVEPGISSSHGLYAPNYIGGATSKRLALPCQDAQEQGMGKRLLSTESLLGTL